MNAKSEYCQLYNALKGKIDAGVYAPGTKLPSERAMIDQFGVSRTTIRRALELLENDKYVSKHPGVGCMVCAQPGEGDVCKLRIGIDIDRINESQYQRSLFQHMQNVRYPNLSVEYLVVSHADVLGGRNDLDGVIMSHFRPGDIARLEKEYRSTVPLCFLNRTPTRADFAYFAVDYTGVSFKIVSRLLKNGARRILVAGYSQSEDYGYAEYTRMQGWMKAYTEFTGSYPEELMFGKNIALQMPRFTDFLQKEHPDVVYVLTGGELPVVWAAMVQAGLVPGKDVDVICFDDIEDFGIHYHPITFVRMQLGRIAAMAVEYFAHRDTMPVPKVFVEPQLIVENCKYLF